MSPISTFFQFFHGIQLSPESSLERKCETSQFSLLLENIASSASICICALSSAQWLACDNNTDYCDGHVDEEDADECCGE